MKIKKFIAKLSDEGILMITFGIATTLFLLIAKLMFSEDVSWWLLLFPTGILVSGQAVVRLADFFAEVRNKVKDDVEETEKELEKLEEKPFPQEGDKYWLIEPDGDVWLNNWEDATCEQKWLEQGNAVKTELEAKKIARARALIQAIKVRRRELNGDYKSDFEKDNSKYAIHYCAGLGINEYVNLNIASPFGYYETNKSAQTIIDEFEDDLVWYFTEYIPEVN